MRLKTVNHQILLQLLLSLSLFSSSLVHSKSTLSDIQIQSFLYLITGPWQGTAVETPIGPRSYDISFNKDNNGHVKGATELNVSTHYWDFSPINGALHLRFLTTFAGNTEPILFKSTGKTQLGYIFNSISRDNVQVIINPEKSKVLIQIRLYNKPHVRIVLTKSN